MIVKITKNGLQREADSKLGVQAMSPVKYLLLTDTAVTDEVDIENLISSDINVVARLPILSADRLASGTIEFSAHIESGESFYIKGVGVELEDGTLYGYAPYRPEAGGFDKPADLAFTLSVIHSFEKSATLEFTYSPLDTASLANSVILKIDQYFNESKDDLEASILANANEIALLKLSQEDNWLSEQKKALAIINNSLSIASQSDGD